jgi:hypothetical protein
MKNNFAHVVTVDGPTRTLKIERLYPDGRRELYTATNIPMPSSGPTGAVAKLASQLGENLLLDSPTARELLGL